MKCQKCEQNATFHITELTGGKPVELHLCQKHAREYLQGEGGEPESLSQASEVLAQYLGVGASAEELARLQQTVCPVCGISFYDFRQQGRLGCPHDYEAFGQELEAVLISVHGETRHVGMRPPRGAEDSQELIQVIRLRRQMHQAAAEEAYEKASQLRDEIQRISQQVAQRRHQPPSSQSESPESAS